jgi:GNAT superfamily N-acetyltransferase
LTLEFRRADPVQDRNPLLRFNVEYLEWLEAQISARFATSLTALLERPIPDYVDATLDKLCASVPPEGVFYLVSHDELPVGMGGLRRVGDGVGEVKRIYASPAVRGRGIGTAIMSRLIKDARAFGFDEIVLDTGPFMTSAHRLYEAAGFVDIPPYPNAEVPEALHYDWRFMRLGLGPAIQA